MIKSISTFAPARVLGQGSADARPATGVAVHLPVVAADQAVQGTGVSSARLRDVVAAGCTPRGEIAPLGTAQFHAQNQSQNDGTTLGFHPSSRPLS
jgi:hypothetical protein